MWLPWTWRWMLPMCLATRQSRRNMWDGRLLGLRWNNKILKHQVGICKHMYVYVYVYIHTCAYVYICISIYICIYIHIYYTYKYIQTVWDKNDQNGSNQQTMVHIWQFNPDPMKLAKVFVLSEKYPEKNINVQPFELFFVVYALVSGNTFFPKTGCP